MDDDVTRRWTSRKLWIAAAIQGLITFIFVLPLSGVVPIMGESTFQWLTMFTWGGYLAGNIGEYIARK